VIESTPRQANAIAARIVFPDRQVVAFGGDGG
jgi:thiamine pyrophosphate-dependent acetolactate synthase large subunit-like protein